MTSDNVLEFRSPDDDPFDLTPPHDIAAEQAVLGAMLLSAQAVERGISALSAGDFYRPAHGTIFAECAAAHRAGDPVDVVTLKARLETSGLFQRVGGAPYLHTLIESVPAASAVGHYAAIVRERAVRRRLIEAGQRIVQQARAQDGEDAFHGMAEKAVREIEAVRDFGGDDNITTQTIKEFLAVPDEEYDWIVPGLLERGDRLILTGQEGAGKALALDTPIPTPKGWTTMGELSVGEEIFGPDGQPARVVFATPVMTGHDCFRVRFSDGSEIVADADHLWVTETLKAREAAVRYAKKPEQTRTRGTDQRHKRSHFPAVVTTREIAGTLRARSGHALNHSIPVCAPLAYPAQELPIQPYTFGAWLGDGISLDAQITCADQQILEEIRRDGYEVHLQQEITYRITDVEGRQQRIADGLALVEQGMSVLRASRQVGIGKDALAAAVGGRTSGWTYNLETEGAPQAPFQFIKGRLRSLGVLGDKHVPKIYLHGSVDQRIALLQGLMDTDGTVSEPRRGSSLCEFSVCNERLAFGVLELLHGLGIKTTMRSGPAKLHGRTVGTRWRLAFQTDLPVFRLERKAERLTPLSTRRAKLRYITAVEPVDSVPVRCIQVDRPDRMYLAGRECIPTHNTTLFRQLGVTIAAGIHPFTGANIEPKRVLILDCENGPAHTRRKIRPLVVQAEALGRPVNEANLWLEVRPEGLDLALDRDVSWLLRRVSVICPDVVMLGPLYRMVPRALNTDDEVAPIIATLNMIRARGACVLVEAHAGHSLGVGGRRDLRPRGSSALLGWPEFGYGIRFSDHPQAKQRRTVDLVPWRGDRDERMWPEMLTAGGTWPWNEFVGLGPIQDGWEGNGWGQN